MPLFLEFMIKGTTTSGPIPEDPSEPPVRNRRGGLWDDGDGLVPVGWWGHLNESLRSLLVIIAIHQRNGSVTT